MTPTNPVTLINVFSVQPENQLRLIELLREVTEEVVRSLDGWIATELVASQGGDQVVIYSRWRAYAAIEAMRADDRMRLCFSKVSLLASLTAIVGETVMSHHS